MADGPQDARIPPRWAARLHPSAVEALEQALLPGEVVEVVVPGPAAQVLLGTTGGSSSTRRAWRRGRRSAASSPRGSTGR